MKKFILLPLLALIISGCAQPMNAETGMTFNALNHMSASTFNQYLVKVKDLGELTIYQSGRVLDKKRLIAQHNNIAASNLNPSEDKYYVFKNNILIRIAVGETEVNSYIQDVEGMKRFGFDKKTEYEFAKEINASKQQIDTLSTYGIHNRFDYENALQSLKSHKNLYGTSSNISTVLQFLSDQQNSKDKNISLEKFVANRKLQEKNEEIAREKAAAEQRALFIKNYPYTATVSCGMGDGNMSVIACFAGGSDSIDTELELTNGEEYKLFKAYNMSSAGEENRDGLQIPLKDHFSIKAQNSSKHLILTITIRKSSSNEITFKKSVGQYNVIFVGN